MWPSGDGAPIGHCSAMLTRESLIEKYANNEGDPRVTNYILIPVTAINPDEDGMKEFNEIYNFCKSLEVGRITRTPSGGISIARHYMRYCMWDVRNTSSCIEITLVMGYNQFRFQFRPNPDHNERKKLPISGSKAFKEFKKICKKFDIDMKDYEIPNGKEVKEEIEDPLIFLTRDTYADQIIPHCYHVDFHNSYPAGLMNTHEEFQPIINYIYEKRLQQKKKYEDGKIPPKDDIYKAVMNLSIGYMQSYCCCFAKWAHLSRDAIADNNKRLKELSKRLSDNGYNPILFNTDGVWYIDSNNQGAYHGEGEGDWCGDWETDHKDCTLRAKSRGAYEFIEDGKYSPVVRGSTRLDKIKPRSEWNWGDIYLPEAEILRFGFDEERGVYLL